MKGKFNPSTFGLLFCMIGYMKPSFISEIASVNKIFDLIRIISFIIIIGYLYKYRFNVSIVTKIAMAFYIYNIIVTILTGGEVLQLIINVITIIGEMCLFEIAIKKNIYKFLDYICKILSLYVVINLLSIILIPNGFFITESKTPIYFLGIHNRFIFWMLPLMCFLCVNAYITKKRITWKEYFIYFVCLVTLIQQWAVGAMLGLGLFIIYFIFISKRKAKIANYDTYLFIYFGMWIILTFTGLLDALQWVTMALFNKGGTIQARLSLWDRAVYYSKKDLIHLLFGYGLEKNEVVKSKFWYIHVHNNLLNVMYQSGIIGAIMYSSMFVSIRNILNKYKNVNVAKVIAFSIFVFLFMLLVDTYDLYGHFYTLLVLGANLPIIIKDTKLKEVVEEG